LDHNRFCFGVKGFDEESLGEGEINNAQISRFDLTGVKNSDYRPLRKSLVIKHLQRRVGRVVVSALYSRA